jgi:hypothetical protein
MVVRNVILSAVCISSALWAAPLTAVSKPNAAVSEGAVPNKLFKFESATVRGIGEMTGFSIVTGSVPDDDSPIKLDRSFKDALLQNIDKESVEQSFQ